MGIKIDKISVKDLGPIKSFSSRFGIFNLIYSINEKGKTFLTEFIIRSLFRNINRWSYLRKGGKGKVLVSGLEKSTTDFSPASLKKLEDYWTENEKGLPASIAKLLVVKGGEAGIDDSEGVSKFFIKEVLSGINILDKIDSDTNISKTIKKAKVEDGRINIADKGVGNKYHTKRNELEEIDTLFEEIESEYSEGVIKSFKLKEKDLKERLSHLDRVKRHRAYLISEKIKKLQAELKMVPEDELSRIENDLTLYRDKKQSLKQEEEKYKTALDESKDLKWMESALPHYKDLTLKNMKKPGISLLVTCYISAAAGVAISVLFFLNNNFFNIPHNIILFSLFFFFSASIVCCLLYIKRLNNFFKLIGQSEELIKIIKEFKKRTGKELSDIALLESSLNRQRESSSRSEAIKERIDILDSELKELRLSISSKIITFTEKDTGEQEWDLIVSNLKRNNRSLKEQIDREKDKLGKFGISEADYLPEETEIEYSPQEYEEIQLKLEHTRKELEIREDKIQELKFKICQKTGDDLSIGWEELFKNLRKKMQDVENELREVTAFIAAGSSVHKIISELRQEEDTKIQEGLQSMAVLDPLKAITQKYDKLTLDGSRLIVSSKYDDFDIRDLSTGAIEQVMLALRIGFTSKLLREDSLFLILDDAFQHSDWQKRKILIDKLAEISKKGWQIIYFTMDDHIKELFDKAGRQFKPGEYNSITL